MFHLILFLISFSSDINPILVAADAVLELHRANSDVPRYLLLSDFYLGDHKIAILDDEVLIAVHIPLIQNSNKYFFRSYKQARRRDNSKGIVSAAFRVQFEKSRLVDGQWHISCMYLVFSGMASKISMPERTQQTLNGLLWTRKTLDYTLDLLLKEMRLNEMSPGGQPEYRYIIIDLLIFRFFVSMFLDEH